MAATRRSVNWLIGAVILLLLAPTARAAERVDLLLVLASDVSRSVDAQKFELQRRGYGGKVIFDLLRYSIEED